MRFSYFLSVFEAHPVDYSQKVVLDFACLHLQIVPVQVEPSLPDYVNRGFILFHKLTHYMLAVMLLPRVPLLGRWHIVRARDHSSSWHMRQARRIHPITYLCQIGTCLLG
jgi:hypothetical protein